MANPKKKPLTSLDNSAEAWKEMPSAVAQTFAHDLAEEGARDFWKQLLGKYEDPEQRDGLQEGKEVTLFQKDKSEKPQKKDVASPGIDYARDILHVRERASSREHDKISQKIQEIIVELQRLVSSSKVLQGEFRDVTLIQAPAEPGKYHVTFFEWLLITIRQARIKVEDSGSWLAAIQSKKGKKNYWAMFKKHGTTFGLSNERVVATQTG